MKNILLIIAFIAGNIYAQNTYYVAPQANGGSDSNSGSIEAPFATIQKAVSTISAGDTIYLRKGTYREEVVLDGFIATTNMPTVIMAYNKEFVSIDGTELIETSWEQHSGNIYKTTLSKDIWQLFIDSAQMVMARWPNAQFSDESIFDHSTWAEGIEGQSSKGFSVVDPNKHDLAATGLNMTDALAILNIGSFKTWTQKVTSHAAGSNEFLYDMEGVGYKSKHHYFYFEGKLDFLDTKNEWFYDKSDKTLYVYTNDGQSPEGRIIQGKTQTYAFDISNSSHVQLKDLYFMATTFKASASENLLIEGCHFAFPNCSYRMLGNDGGLDVTTLGVPAGNVHNSVIRKCLFEHTDGEGLRIYGNNNTLENCYFHHIDYTASELEGLMVSILISGNSNLITKNTIHSTGASATVLPGDESEFSYNKVTQTGSLQSDGAVYQGTKNTVYNSNTHHNLIYQTPKYALRYDAPVGDASAAGTEGKMHHNVCFETNGMMVKGDKHIIAYNTCYSNTGNGIIILDEDGSNVESVVQNNFAEKLGGHRSNSPTVTPIPGKVSHNWNGYDHTGTDVSTLISKETNIPLENSVLIDAGIEIDKIERSFNGSAPDIGAFEFGEEPWLAGADWTPNFYPYNGKGPIYTSMKREAKAFNDQFSVYPNPVQDFLNIAQIGDDIKCNEIKIYNTKGEIVFVNQFNFTAYKVNMNEYSKGLYWVVISNKDGKQVVPVIKE